MGAKLAAGKILTGTTRDAWKAAFKRKYETEGWSIRKLMRWSGRSYGGTHSLLLEAGVTLRPRGDHAGRKAKNV